MHSRELIDSRELSDRQKQKLIEVLDNLLKEYGQDGLFDSNNKNLVTKKIFITKNYSLTYLEISQEWNQSFPNVGNSIFSNIGSKLFKQLKFVLNREGILNDQEAADSVNLKSIFGNYVIRIIDRKLINFNFYASRHYTGKRLFDPISDDRITETYNVENQQNKYILKRISSSCPTTEDNYKNIYLKELFFFKKEIINLINLSSINCQQVSIIKDYWEDEKYLNFTYKLGSARSKKLLENQKTWEQKDAIYFLKESFSIIEKLHSKKIIVGYLKPENIYVEPTSNSDYKLLITDFSCAENTQNRQKQNLKSINISSRDKINKSPYCDDLMKGNTPKFCSDIFSLGRITVHGLHGFQNDDFQKINPFEDTLNLDWINENINKKTTDNFRQLINKMIAYNFLERFQSISEAQQALDQIN